MLCFEMCFFSSLSQVIPFNSYLFWFFFFEVVSPSSIWLSLVGMRCLSACSLCSVCGRALGFSGHRRCTVQHRISCWKRNEKHSMQDNLPHGKPNARGPFPWPELVCRCPVLLQMVLIVPALQPAPALVETDTPQLRLRIFAPIRRCQSLNSGWCRAREELWSQESRGSCSRCRQCCRAVIAVAERS